MSTAYDMSARRFEPPGISGDIARLTDGLMSREEVIALFQIASPLIPVNSIYVAGQDLRMGGRDLELVGGYPALRYGAPAVRYRMGLRVERGEIVIRQRDINVAEPFQRLGIGMRSLLALALFALRHGVESWGAIIAAQGMLAWPGMGFEPGERAIDSIRANLEKLSVRGIAANGFTADQLRQMDLAAMARLTLSAEELLDPQGLRTWIVTNTERTIEEVAALTPPYPVGIIALEMEAAAGHYQTKTVLKKLMQERIPGKLISGFAATRGASKGDRAGGRGGAVGRARRTGLRLRRGLERDLDPRAAAADGKGESGGPGIADGRRRDARGDAALNFQREEIQNHSSFS